MCADGWELDEKPNGVCPKCGEDTLDEYAVSGCNYSPEICDLCHSCPCDQSC